MTDAEVESVVDDVLEAKAVLAHIIITLSVAGEIRSNGIGLDRPRLNMMIATAHQDLLAKLAEPAKVE